MRYVLAILFCLLFSISTFACEFLIYARDYEVSYKKGDIVAVFPDGHKWGRLEGPPKFIIIKVPSMSVKEGRKYITGGTVDGKEVRRRFYIPKGLLDKAIKQGGIIKIDKTNVSQNIKDKVKGE